LIDCIVPGGTLLLFADDERTLKLQHRLPAPDAKIVTFGFSEEADVRGEHFTLLHEVNGQLLGMRGGIAVGDGRVLPVDLVGAIGAHAFLPLIAAVAVGKSLGIDDLLLVEGARAYSPPPGRMRLISGIKHSLIIDDTYNASPAAAAAAL